MTFMRVSAVSLSTFDTSPRPFNCCARSYAALASSRFDLSAAVAPLVRLAMLRHDHVDALGSIDRARPFASGEDAIQLDTWRAEILARDDQPEAALAVYRGLIGTDAAGAELALDAALTMLDNRHQVEAESLLQTARALARHTGRRSVEDRAEEILARFF